MNVTHAEKHTSVIMNSFTSEYITMYTLFLPSGSVTMYAPSFLLLRSGRDCLPPAASPFGVVSSTSWQYQQCWFLWDACEVAVISPRLSPAPRATSLQDASVALASDKTTASTVTPNPFRMAWLCKLCAEPFVIAWNSASPVLSDRTLCVLDANSIGALS